MYFLSDCNFSFSNKNSIIVNWNNTVKFGDIVYHIGDFTALNFEFAFSIIQQLNGEIHFLAGSHDNWMKGISKKLIQNVKSNTGQQCCFEPEIISVETGYRNKNAVPIILCHYPMTLWQGSHSGSLHAFGHCNGNLMNRTARSIDVSYSVHLKPMNINFIISWLKGMSEI
jgi:calcineurin-like phosphoesterase family protein